ncbi:MAG: ABC transporter ATP-binding protein/permease [Phormidesmis sp.]
MRQYLSKVLYVLSDKHKQLAVMLVVFMFVSVLEALGIGLIGPFLSVVGNPDIVRDHSWFGSLASTFGLESDQQIIVVSAILVLGIFCFKSLAYFLCKVYIYRFGYQCKQELESRLVYTYLNISYLFHLNRNSATLINNLAFESIQFTSNCLIPLLEIVANMLVVVLLLGLLAATDPALMTMALAVLLPIFGLFAWLSRRIRSWGRIKSNAQEGMIRAVNHGLGGLKETKVLGCESYFESDLRDYSKQYGDASTQVDSLQLMPKVAIETSLVVFLILFVLISQLLLGRDLHDMTAILGVFALASIRMIPASSQTLNAVGRMRSMSYALDMLYKDLKEIESYGMPAARPLVTASSAPISSAPISAAGVSAAGVSAAGAIAASTSRAAAALEDRSSRSRPARAGQFLASQFETSVSLKGITFFYPNTKEPAIADISLDIRKGESIALVGKSGSGKTTLVDIILGLLQPSSGDILVDDQSVYTDLRAWQNLLGYIPQSIFLTDETIAQNIAFGIPVDEIDYERVNKAVKAAQLEDLVEHLPDGLETMVGERGMRISGGQRQRVGIARALYYEREILVLDEATSALDSETEKLVSDAINSLAGDKTLIIIAHRVSTIENCDRIYRLEDGRLQQSGTYEEVVLAASR